MSDSVQRRQKYHKSDEYRCKKYKKITGSVLLVEETFHIKVQKCQEIRGEKKSTKVSSIQWLKEYN